MASINTKLALRSLRKNKTFTLLNILGLTLGLTTFILIALYIKDELSFDRFNKKADRIVRINTDLINEGKTTSFADAAPPIAPTLKTHFPEVESAARIFPEEGIRFRQGGQDITEKQVATVDPEFFDIFTLPAIEGDPAKALNQPRTVVLTATTAQRYFHTTNAVGKTLERTDEKSIYTVVAVIKDIPEQSSFNEDIFLTMKGTQMDKGNNSFYAIFPMSTFVLLRPGADRQAFDKKLSTLMRTYVGDYASLETGSNGRFAIRHNSIPLTQIHLHSHRTDELRLNSDIQYIYIFSAIAVFVLLIAGINFMNLSTARSTTRAREVGVRKVLGSGRRQLIAQFLSESIIVTTLAMILAFLAAWLALPAFNHLTGKTLTLDQNWLLPIALAIIAIVGLFSGAWPAFFLSAFRPVQVLKGQLAKTNKSSFRNLLVVVQFSISIFLIVGALVVYKQLNYIQHRDIGYNRSQLLIVKDLDGIANPQTLKTATTQIPGVLAASLTDFLPTNDHRWHNWGNIAPTEPQAQTQNTQSAPGKSPASNRRRTAAEGGELETQLWIVNEDYIPTLGMHIAQGRNFSKNYGTDTSAAIINETAAKAWGIDENPIGKTIHYPTYWGTAKDFTIVGVVKDFNFSSIRSNVTPLVMVDRPQDDQSGLNIRIEAGHIPDVIAKFKNVWATYAPHKPLNYSFMDQDFDAVYHAEERMGSIVVILTALAIAIACLGLLGLAAYASEQRSKEIGIRKILGANITSIVTLLSKDFARLIGISIVIATPAAWLAMDRWLQNFAYRTSISVWLFVTAAAIIGVVAAATTIYQSLKAAVANPVETLRSE